MISIEYIIKNILGKITKYILILKVIKVWIDI